MYTQDQTSSYIIPMAFSGPISQDSAMQILFGRFDPPSTIFSPRKTYE
jgi:hypothetical protein